jgi:hypothetical protein
VAKVLAALTSLCELGLFQKMRIWELMSATLGFLYHPNMWIQQGDIYLLIYCELPDVTFFLPRGCGVHRFGNKASALE